MLSSILLTSIQTMNFFVEDHGQRYMIFDMESCCVLRYLISECMRYGIKYKR
jgi:hypothetical protein